MINRFGAGHREISNNQTPNKIEQNQIKLSTELNYYVNLLLISKLCGHFHPLPKDCVFCKKLNSA